MNNIKRAFENGPAFIGFLTAGDRSVNQTIAYIETLEKAGASLVEIGIPFSDPVAEGPIIQGANMRALSGGMNIHKVFDLVIEVRKKSEIPLVFLTYLNPVFHYGYEAFFKKCQEVQIDGIIIPDLPFEEKCEVEHLANQHKIDLISLIAPNSKARVKMIAKESKGFIYLISSMSTTGTHADIKADLEQSISEIRSVSDTPIVVGFGINTPEQARELAQQAEGIIVGSAIVNIIEKYGTNKDGGNKELFEYVSGMVESIKND